MLSFLRIAFIKTSIEAKGYGYDVFIRCSRGVFYLPRDENNIVPLWSVELNHLGFMDTTPFRELFDFIDPLLTKAGEVGNNIECKQDGALFRPKHATGLNRGE